MDKLEPLAAWVKLVTPALAASPEVRARKETKDPRERLAYLATRDNRGSRDSKVNRELLVQLGLPVTRDRWGPLVLLELMDNRVSLDTPELLGLPEIPDSRVSPGQVVQPGPLETVEFLAPLDNRVRLATLDQLAHRVQPEQPEHRARLVPPDSRASRARRGRRDRRETLDQPDRPARRASRETLVLLDWGVLRERLERSEQLVKLDRWATLARLVTLEQPVHRARLGRLDIPVRRALPDWQAVLDFPDLPEQPEQRVTLELLGRRAT